VVVRWGYKVVGHVARAYLFFDGTPQGGYDPALNNGPIITGLGPVTAVFEALTAGKSITADWATSGNW
jgi:hypothetical protein